MTESEDCQLSYLQCKFKKLKVDLSSSQIDAKVQEKQNGTPESKQDNSVTRILKPVDIHRCVMYTLKNWECSKAKRRRSREDKFKKQIKHSVLISHDIYKIVPADKKSSQTDMLHAKESDTESLEEHLTFQKRNTSDKSRSFSPRSDDVTVDELAGYFDTFVHIPKKMSEMAEMMYT